MKVKTLKLVNIRSFGEVSNEIELGDSINILTGKNNAGKSTILKALYQLFGQNLLKPEDIRIDKSELNIVATLKEIESKYIEPIGDFPNLEATLDHNIKTGTQDSRTLKNIEGRGFGGHYFSNEEPRNFIYPFFSSRKSTTLSEEVNRRNNLYVDYDLNNLVTKIDSLMNPDSPSHDFFKNACQDILGYRISTSPSEKGKKIGLLIDEYKSIPIERMGDGIINIVGLLQQLSAAKGKLFIIEEIENDLEPEALKSLLKIILKKSDENQFVISTHSNIVMNTLGSKTNTKIFNIEMEINSEKIPSTTITEAKSKSERIKILERLGYDLMDFDLWKGWLILEESSAEVIIRDYLIPWFVPNLSGKLRTMSTDGTSKMEAKFYEFQNIFIFIHLTNIYNGKAWVVADGDSSGKEVILKLQKIYENKWENDNFLNFSKENFEEYYPSKFDKEIDEIKLLTDSKDKRKAKKELINNLKQWIPDNLEVAKKEFSVKAKEIISLLEKIDNSLNG